MSDIYTRGFAENPFVGQVTHWIYTERFMERYAPPSAEERMAHNVGYFS